MIWALALLAVPGAAAKLARAVVVVGADGRSVRVAATATESTVAPAATRAVGADRRRGFAAVCRAADLAASIYEPALPRCV